MPLTEDQALVLCKNYLLDRYGVVPLISTTSHLVELNMWVIYYKMSWDTDEQGLPISLILRVDGSNNSVHPLMPLE